MTFDQFGWRGLGASPCGTARFNQLVGLACSYYASELAADRTATVVPRLGQPPAEQAKQETRTLVLELDEESLRRLEREAERRTSARRACASMLRYSTSLTSTPAGWPNGSPAARILEGSPRCRSVCGLGC